MLYGLVDAISPLTAYGNTYIAAPIAALPSLALKEVEQRRLSGEYEWEIPVVLMR